MSARLLFLVVCVAAARCYCVAQYDATLYSVGTCALFELNVNIGGHLVAISRRGVDPMVEEIFNV